MSSRAVVLKHDKVCCAERNNAEECVSVCSDGIDGGVEKGS